MLNFDARGGQRRFRPDPELLARQHQINEAARRSGQLSVPIGAGRDNRRGAQTGAPAGAGKIVQPFTSEDGGPLLNLSFDVPSEGANLGGRFFEPGRRVMLQWDPNARVMLHGGQKIEAALNPSKVHDTTEMSTYLAGYHPTDFIHELVSPVAPVDYDEDKIPVVDSNHAFMPVDVKTTDDDAPRQIDFNRTLTPYKVFIRRVAVWLPDPTMRQQTNPNLNLKFLMGDRAARVLHLDLELDTVGPSGLLTTAANWNANNRLVLAAGYQWGGPSGIGALSNPIADVRTIRNASAMIPQTIVFNQVLAGLFLDHPKTRDYFRAQIGDSQRDVMVKAVSDVGDEEIIRFSIAGLGNFMVAGAKYATTLNGVPDFIMPNDTAVCFRVPKGGAVPTSGVDIGSSQTFRRKGPAGVGFYTREVYMSWIGAGGTMLIVEEASVPKMTAPIVGGIITGAYQ